MILEGAKSTYYQQKILLANDYALPLEPRGLYNGTQWHTQEFYGMWGGGGNMVTSLPHKKRKEKSFHFRATIAPEWIQVIWTKSYPT